MKKTYKVISCLCDGSIWIEHFTALKKATDSFRSHVRDAYVWCLLLETLNKMSHDSVNKVLDSYTRGKIKI